MANSKANIYPIQLQGAELNLNKFDAEIKQYSGFNKNNSPFVGGCLSNLFTKTEENTTGSSDSIYVDDNGDVYEVKTDSLYKNGEIILKLSNNVSQNLVDLEKIDLPANTIFVAPIPVTVDGKRDYKFLYITFESTDFNTTHIKLHYNGVEQNVGCTLYAVSTPITELQFSVDSYNNILIRGAANYEDKVYMEAWCLKYDNTTDTFSFYSNFNPRLYVNNEDYIKMPPVACDFAGSVYGLDETYDFTTGEKLSFTESGSADKTTCLGKSKYFIYTAGGSSNYIAYLVDVTDYTTNGVQSIVLCANVNLNSGIIDKDSYNTVTSASYPSGTTLSVKLGKIDNNYDIGGLCYALKFSDNKLFYGVAGEGCFTNQVTLVEDGNGEKQAMLYMGVKSGNKLYNNGTLTGISVIDTLVTEWNSVIPESVSVRYQGDIVTYKSTSGEWFCVRFNNVTNQYLHKFKPKISKINNLLVMNYTGNNSYNLVEKKACHFAPDWNNRIFFDNSQITKSDVAITDNVGYMATSINEYKIRDNASILLNPVPVIILPTFQLKNYDGSIDFIQEEIKNLYTGTEEEIKYRCSFITGGGNTSGDIRYSWIKTLFCNKDLYNLLFPINTNGNVQLSPSLFCEIKSFGNDVFIKEGRNAYQLIKDGNESVMSYYLGTLIENLEEVFILQGQYYAIINKQIFNVQFSGGVVQNISFVVSVENLQFCGNSVYQAYFFSKTNRCLYTFTGANILNQMQLIDKISEIYAYKYNQSTQSIILITDMGTIVSSNLGMYLLEDFTPDDVFFYDKGVVFVSDSELKYLQYYESENFEKHNIELETCFYGVSNETVSVNDCLYIRLFSEEHEEGEIKISATTLANTGRKTEETTFKITSNDWDKMTHSLYLRYQPKTQRGLGVSFSINSPFKIASMSVGTQADAILIDKVSKGAINAPAIKSSNVAW